MALPCWSWLGEQAPSWPGTTWEEDANLSIGPAIGLPRLPVAPKPGSPEDTELYEAYGPLPRQGREVRALGAGAPVRVVRGRGGGEGRDALASQPHLVIWVDPCAGLARPHLDEAQRWLLALPVCGVY
jgi:hypothetical protein